LQFRDVGREQLSPLFTDMQQYLVRYYRNVVRVLFRGPVDQQGDRGSIDDPKAGLVEKDFEDRNSIRKGTVKPLQSIRLSGAGDPSQ
jgi:hypothetical protein